jgi:DNA modification methylase
MEPEVTLVHGSGAHMRDLVDESAQLILTSPPYFPDDLEPVLREGLNPNVDLTALQVQIQTYAWSLRPVFAECFRVLAPGGRLILQTRDVRLRHVLVAVEGTHREMLEALGLSLYARHFWRPAHTTKARRRMAAAMAGSLGPAPFDPEVFLVFWKKGATRRGTPTPGDEELLQKDCAATVLGRLPASHRYQSPLPILKALIRAHSRPGDLVVDPFSGGGSILVVARALGRSAWGCDVDPQALELARMNTGLAEVTAA